MGADYLPEGFEIRQMRAEYKKQALLGDVFYPAVKLEMGKVTVALSTDCLLYTSRSNGSGKTYICIGIGEHCYIWMDKNMKADYDAAGKTSLIASDMASIYDRQPYHCLLYTSPGKSCSLCKRWLSNGILRRDNWFPEN